MKIEVLGPGCLKCKKTYETVNQALSQLGETAEVVKIEKIDEIVSRGVLMTPAVVIDGVVQCSGRAPTVAEITTFIAAALAKNGQ